MDVEISAMGKLTEALESLDESARSRVLRWASDRYDITLNATVKKPSNSNYETDDDEADDDKEFETFADLYVATNPSATTDKLLVAGYWHQVIGGSPDFFSGTLNKDLKDLGHAVSSISKLFDTLMNQKPQLAVQLKKSGNSKQAKKKYKITHAGIKRVKDMMASD